jgi:hypothetical protein
VRASASLKRRRANEKKSAKTLPWHGAFTGDEHRFCSTHKLVSFSCEITCHRILQIVTVPEQLLSH